MRYFVLLSLIVFISSCTDTSGSNCDFTTNFCSCDETSNSPSTCSEYKGWTESGAQENCEDTKGGSFSNQQCDTSGVLGTCTLSLLGGSNQTVEHYYSDASTGQTACTLAGGDWD